MRKLIYILIISLSLVYQAFAQDAGFRTRKFILNQDTIKLDSLSILPGSVMLFHNGETLPESKFIVLDEKKSIVINSKLSGAPKPLDTLIVSYKVFPFDLNKTIFKKDYRSLLKDIEPDKDPFTIRFNDNNKPSDYFQSDGLNKNGSISRGISFGNNQDVVVNSSMNLQVSGKLTKDLEIVLAATDNNIPIQPEGNTQQLQEFDKVFVQVNDKSSKLIVGDFQLSRPNSYFMNFYKRTQGVYFSNTYATTQKKQSTGVFTTNVSGAVSRGRFARNVIVGRENNQGPYRLKGAENELFIIVLSGTEKVYVDGKLLTRGQENEYIIDYNTSEITFTAKQIITKDKRITIEFQYAEKNYARSLVFIGEEYKTSKMRAYINVYQESDNKNKPFQQSLSSDEKTLLASIGDTLSSAITQGYSLSEFNTIEVFYKKTDSLIGATTYPNIFVYTTNPADTTYRVRFSYVGENSGNYKQIQSAANGKLYQWYEPVAGIKQGNYEPIVLLATPKKKQMMTVGSEINFGHQGSVLVEAAFTKNDKNTFSPFDSEDDNSQAIKTVIQNKSLLNKNNLDSVRPQKLFLTYGLNYEFLQKNFGQIERFRSIEFDRDWNRKRDTVFNDQHIGGANLGIEFAQKLKTVYTIQSFYEGNSYAGLKHQLSHNMRIKATTLNYTGSLLQTNAMGDKTQFYRHKAKVSQDISVLRFTFQDELEENKFFSKSDSLWPKSYSFWEWEGSVANADTTKNQFKLFYRERTDKKSSNNYLKGTAYAQNTGMSADIFSIRNHPIKIMATYRKLQILDSTLISIRPDDNLLGRLEYSPRIWKGFIQSNIFYELGYGLEPRKEYSYVQVAQGQGTFTWNDYNDNGIKELNEFEVAQYTDQASFIRIYTPTNDYIKTNHNQLSWSLFLRPAVFKTQTSGGAMNFLSRWATQTAFRLDKKSTGTDELENANPFESAINDSMLIATNYSFRQAIFFNQTSAVAGADYTYQDNRSKQLLTNGFESRSFETNELRLRWNINRIFSVFLNSTYGHKRNRSELFITRSYDIEYYDAEPKFTFQPNTSFRLSVLYKRSEKRNVFLFNNQKSIVDDYGVELRYNQLAKGSFNMRFDYLNISFNDVENTPLAFEMLNSLRPGENMTWSASYQYNLSANLQISINYDGRKSPNNKMIHIGGAQIRAFF